MNNLTPTSYIEIFDQPVRSTNWLLCIKLHWRFIYSRRNFVQPWCWRKDRKYMGRRVHIYIILYINNFLLTRQGESTNIESNHSDSTANSVAFFHTVSVERTMWPRSIICTIPLVFNTLFCRSHCMIDQYINN